MRKVTVQHSHGRYTVSAKSVAEAVQGFPSGSFVVTDRNVWGCYKGYFDGAVPVFSLEPGESSKSVESLEAVWRWLAKSGANRRSTLVAFGGGVVGDLAGFAASTYMRGIDCIQVATSLMAMVDSSVGGKVGIDLPEGKNMAGSFHPPIWVDVCMDALKTLPERHLRNGIAEVIKYAFIADPSLLEAVEGQNDAIAEDVVMRCVEIKAGIVESDEFETAGERAKLNFGHTVGHALEALTGYRSVLHGEAVAIGMVAESYLAMVLGLSDQETFESVKRAVRSAGLPEGHDCLKDPKLVDFMMSDKKRTGRGLAFSFVVSPGTCKLIEDVSDSAVRSALQSL